MMKKIAILMALLFLLLAAPAWAGSNILTWMDNSTNEQNFEVWAKPVPTPAGNPPPPPNCAADPSPYTILATVGINVVTFTHTGLTEGAAWCYEVRATNVVGPSAFSNVAGRSIPFTAVNGAPSGLGVAPGP